MTKTDEQERQFVCDGCARQHGFQAKRPADSGASSWLCVCCGHNNIGSYMMCKMGPWLTRIPKEYCND